MLAYHGAMQKTGAAILSTAAEVLGLAESELTPLFADAGSTLRLLNYRRKPGTAAIKEEMPQADGARLVTGRHVDACAFSVLWQRQPGLQAETPGGRWLEIPTIAGTVSVHVGSVMEFFTGGRWRATPRRDRIFSRTQSGRRSITPDRAVAKACKGRRRTHLWRPFVGALRAL